MLLMQVRHQDQLPRTRGRHQAYPKSFHKIIPKMVELAIQVLELVQDV
ncbi:MAG: hypothetical protein ACYCOU_05600 [Sulfobacillus sp.]